MNKAMECLGKYIKSDITDEERKIIGRHERFGVTNCFARDSIYWERMNSDTLEEGIRNGTFLNGFKEGNTFDFSNNKNEQNIIDYISSCSILSAFDYLTRFLFTRAMSENNVGYNVGRERNGIVSIAASPHENWFYHSNKFIYFSDYESDSYAIIHFLFPLYKNGRLVIGPISRYSASSYLQYHGIQLNVYKLDFRLYTMKVDDV